MSLAGPRLSWPSDRSAYLAADWCPQCGIYGDGSPCRDENDREVKGDHPERRERAEAKLLYAGREGERLEEEARDREALVRNAEAL